MYFYLLSKTSQEANIRIVCLRIRIRMLTIEICDHNKFMADTLPYGDLKFCYSLDKVDILL